MVVTVNIRFLWTLGGTQLTDREINLLFEIFRPLPRISGFTLRSSSMIGLGSSEILLSDDDDQINEILLGYINGLTLTQQLRVKDLIVEWVQVATKIVKFSEAEGVKFRVAAPSEQRAIIKSRIQTYIPIFTQQEFEAYQISGDTDSFDNTIMRG